MPPAAAACAPSASPVARECCPSPTAIPSERRSATPVPTGSGSVVHALERHDVGGDQYHVLVVLPWSYYSMTDGRPFFMAGLWAEASDPATGEVADTYTLIITDANATMRVHDRMPVILATDAARRWIEPGPLPAELLVPYPAEEMTAWRVADDAKNSRIEPHPGMAEPVAGLTAP